MNAFGLAVLGLSALLLASCGDERAGGPLPERSVMPSASTRADPVGVLGPEGMPFAYAPDGTAEALVQREAMDEIYQVEAARVALQRAQSLSVRQFAETTIDPAAYGRDLAALRPPAGVRTPTALDPQHQRLLNALRRVGRGDFDPSYVGQQRAALAVQLERLDGVAERATDPKLKAWAERRVGEVREDLARAHSLPDG